MVGSLTAAGVVVHRVLHPILAVRRDADGRLVDVLGDAALGGSEPGVLRESWIHVLIDRLADATRAEAIEERLAAALDDVRAIVADAPALMPSLSAAARDLRWTPSAAAGREITEAADLLDWFAAGT